MAADQPYHLLPEDNRPSMDTMAGDDQRLLSTDPLYDDDDDDEAAPKKGHNIKISYHPTFYIRLLVLCLHIAAMAVLAASKLRLAIPAVIFLAVAILRNLVVLFIHLVGHCFIRVNIELVGRAPWAKIPKPIARRPAWATQRWIQLVMDWILIVLLIITSVVAWYQMYSRIAHLVMAGSVLCWVSIPLHALSSVDMGRPNRITAFHLGEDKDSDDTAPAAVYRDVEGSGGLQADMTRKTGADSPPMS